ncbi:MAG: leucine-rich repeat domain-containing protein, partial [Clostridia bacterium]|nr:leucine-rich repeat domain-containing protein [Clostridia bacterium]
MKTKTSVIFTLLSLLCVLCLLASCNSGASKTEPPAGSPSAEESVPTESTPVPSEDQQTSSKDEPTPTPSKDEPTPTPNCEHEAVTDSGVEPTCTEKGKTEGSHCSKCNVVLKAQEEVPAKGHTWQDATCETPKTCSVCKKTEGDLGEHNWSDGQCSVCGEIKTSEGLKYVLDGDSYIVTGIGTCEDVNIVIPGTYKDKPVTAIADKAFKHITYLKSVVIPDSVTSIGDSAFNGCSGLTSITIPFVGANKDGSSKTNFGYIFGAPSYSYNSHYIPTSLKTVVITGGTSIGEGAFYRCTGLTSITIPDSVTSIGNS